MSSFSASVAPAAMKVYDFRGIRTLVDVGGGHGQVLTTILRAHPAMHASAKPSARKGGKVILLESVLRPGNEPDYGKLMDVQMLVMPGGRERTEAEFAALFSRTGFALTRIEPTESALSVVEARAVQGPT